jgi:uncharacterized protein YdaU (DUF1376 family)
MVMTLLEEGAYRRLLDFAWREGSIPTDPRKLSALLKGMSTKDVEKVWPAISDQWEPHPTLPERVVNPRQEQQRQDLASFKAERSESGKRGAQARWKRDSANGSAIHEPMADDSTTSASATASATEHHSVFTDVNTGDWEPPF